MSRCDREHRGRVASARRPVQRRQRQGQPATRLTRRGLLAALLVVLLGSLLLGIAAGHLLAMLPGFEYR